MPVLLEGFGHFLHITYSLYNPGCFVGTNSSNPSHHKDCFEQVMGIVKYVVTSLIASSSPSESGAWVACKDKSTTLFCRLAFLTRFNCFSRSTSEMAGRFLEMAGGFRCFFCLLCWTSPPSLLLRFCFPPHWPSQPSLLLRFS
jgi:hypothetical protein